MERDVLELAGSLGFVDEMYQRFLEDQAAVDPSWRDLLGEPRPGAAPGPSAHAGSNGSNGGNGHGATSVARFAAAAAATVPRSQRPGRVTLAPLARTPSLWPLVNAYRARGHLLASLDPLGLLESVRVSELEPQTWGIAPGDLDRDFGPTGVHGLEHATAGQVLAHLRATYADTIGIEFMHVPSPGRRSWLANRMETRHRRPPDAPTRRRMLQLLVNAETFEHFCHVKYPGTKRFSLEGAETLIPLLDLVLTHGARLGAIETVLGMAHRGRLTTIDQILARPPREIFAEFEDVEPEASLGGGDVKYHLGFSTDRVDRFGRQHARVACRSTPATSRPSIRSWSAGSGPSRPGTATSSTGGSSASRSTATPRSPARAWCPRPST